MKRIPGVVALALLAGVSLGAQAKPEQTKPETKKASEVRMLTGCVTPSATSKKQFTLTDTDSAEMYRLTGTDVREFVGQHVEILGAPSTRLVIKGGLYPSANVAAQAGAIDPVQAAIAAQSGPTSNDQRPLVDFRVRSVRPTPGDCPKQ